MLHLPADLTHQQAGACLSKLVQGLQAEPGPLVVVDASALGRFDSSALAVLLACRRAVLASGKNFAIRGMPAHLHDLAALYGIDSLLPAA